MSEPEAAAAATPKVSPTAVFKRRDFVLMWIAQLVSTAGSALTDLAAGRGMARNLLMGDGLVEPISVAEVTASTFAMTRVAPILGRTLTDADASAAAPPVAVIGERIWRDRFGADPDFLGKTVLISDVPTAVVGVMPAAYRFPSIYEVWQPLKINESAVQPRAGIGVRIWARMKPGVTLSDAQQEIASIGTQIGREHADYGRSGLTLYGVGLHSDGVREIRPTLLALFAGVAILLVVACGIFVAAEFALVTVDRNKVDQLAAEGDAGAIGVQRALRSL